MSKGGPFNTDVPIVMPEHRGNGSTPGCWSRRGKMVQLVCPQCESRQAEVQIPSPDQPIRLECECGFDHVVTLLDLHVKGGT